MKTLLVAIDYSDATEPVVDLVRDLAKALGAEVHLIHVKEVSGTPATGAMTYGALGMTEMMSGGPVPMLEPVAPIEAEPVQQKKLNEWQKKLIDAGLKVTLHEPTGVTFEEILREADAVQADFIVMGTHGHGAMYNLLVGSVTKGVLKHSTRPVLLVPSSQS
jgi:nucleotide-binding universal stress UspA family protein